MNSVLRFFTAFTVMSLVAASCGDKDKKDNQRSEPGCENGLASGTNRDQTLFTSDFAPYGKTCQQIAFQGKAVCENGQIGFTSSGRPSCEETILKKITVKGSRSQIEIGETLALELTGTDQRGGTFPIDVQTVIWETNDNSISVTNSGLITGSKIVPDAAVYATVMVEGKEVFGTFRVGVTGRNCEGTAHNLNKEFTRFKAAKVPFNATCQEVTTEALCNNGTFEFEEGVAETCSVAQLSSLVADPSSLFLSEGETAAVFLSLVDEIGTRIPLDASAAEWTLPTDQLSHSNGQITALVNLTSELKVQVKAKDQAFSTEITVASRADQPESLRFEQGDQVLKEGDEVELKALSVIRGQTEAVDPKRLTWESSAPTNVSVSEGRVKALKAGTLASITAKLDQTVISLNVTVEEKLSLDAKLIDGRELTADKLSLLPAVLATVTGPLQSAEPELKNGTEGCEFSIHKNRKVWELDVKIDENRGELPGACEVEIALKSAAGQTAQQKVTVPVDYRRFSFKEIRAEGTEGRLEIGRFNYKLSKNLSVVETTVQKFSNKEEISPADCELSTEEKDGTYTVFATRAAGSSGICSGYLAFEFKKEGVEENRYHYQLLVQSPDKTFLEHCQSPRDEAVRATVNAVRKILAPSASCEKLVEVLDEKNLYSAANNDDTLSLSMANQKLTDLSPLSRFVGLKELDLAANLDLSDISALAEVKLLKLLNLKGTAVSDFSAIYKHKRMNDLRIPSQVRIACSDAVVNPELKKVCQ